mgnify:CR=1 FL=1
MEKQGSFTSKLLMPRIIILGLDGLEYDFVERWNLKNLKQREFGKLEVPINKDLGVPMSPEVWAAFLTGKYLPGLEFTRTPIVDFILEALRFMRKRIPVSLGLGRRIRIKVPLRFPELKERTFLDLTNSKEINVPYYSYDHKIFKIMNQFNAGKLSLREAVNEVLNVYIYRKRRILYEFENLGDFDVIFAFMHFPDALQHLLLNKPLAIRELYFDLDSYVSRLKRRVDASMFLIVSDHGFDLETKEHSMHGFYSSNVPLDPRPRRITDFYNLIVKEIECKKGV